jgi:hypothetical protein
MKNEQCIGLMIANHRFIKTLTNPHGGLVHGDGFGDPWYPTNRETV